MQKKYNFNKILEEYNEKYNYSYNPPSGAHNIVIIHTLETNNFYVTYSDAFGIKRGKKPLVDFLHHHISTVILWDSFKEIILSKEEKMLGLEIKIWPSSKIRYAYLESNYFAITGNLGKSCMRVKGMQKALNFYVKNNVRVVVAVNSNNKIYARALLWDNVKSTKLKLPFTYLDRVYTKSDTLLPLFYNLANKNKWKYYPSTTVNMMDGNYYIENINVAGMCYLPFMDTFRHLYLQDNLLAASTRSGLNEKSTSSIVLSEHSNGGYYPNLDPNRVKEVITGNFISKKDATFIKRYDGYVLKEHIVDIKGDYYSSNDTKLQDTALDGYILKKDTVEEVLTKQPINKITAIHSIKYNGFIHKSNIVDIEGEIYHKKDTNITCFEDNWYYISQCFTNYDRKERNEEAEKLLFCSYLYQNYEPCANIISKNDLIPKKLALIAYDLFYNPALNLIEYQEVYCTNKDNTVQLVTGELIVSSTENRKLLKKFNNKYYIRQTFKLSNKQIVTLPDTEQTFKPPNKKQLQFSFVG